MQDVHEYMRKNSSLTIAICREKHLPCSLTRLEYKVENFDCNINSSRAPTIEIDAMFICVKKNDKNLAYFTLYKGITVHN